MGLFDFLKKFLREREKKENKLIKEIKFQEVKTFIENELNKAHENTNYEMSEIRKKFNDEKEKLKENLRNLEKAELKNSSISEKAKQIMRGNRETYIGKVNSFLKNVEIPIQNEELLKFCEFFDTSLSNLEKSIGRNHQIVQEFFIKEVNAIMLNVKNLDFIAKQISKIISKNKIQEINELKIEIKNLNEQLSMKEQIKKQINLLEDELNKERKNSKETEEKIKEIRGQESYKKLISIQNKQSELENKIKEEEKRIFHLFSEVEPALKKYFKLHQNEKLVERYLNEPISALFSDQELKILEIIANVKNAISKNEIDLKDKKREKILKELNNINENSFTLFLKNYAELNKNKEELESKIGEISVIMEINELNKNLDVHEKKAAEMKKEIEKLESNFDNIGIKNLISNLENKINNIINENIKIAY